VSVRTRFRAATCSADYVAGMVLAPHCKTIQCSVQRAGRKLRYCFHRSLCTAGATCCTMQWHAHLVLQPSLGWQGAPSPPRASTHSNFTQNSLPLTATRSRRWVDATAGEEAVLAEILERWQQPQHEGGCGTSGRLT
jgi:hypothetical protein